MTALISKKIENNHIIYKFFGVKFSIKYQLLAAANKMAIKVQDTYDLLPLQKAEKLILFLVPGEIKINGGVMSIYSLCETSREINKDSVCLISTYSNDSVLYAKNDAFINDEKVFRFSQIVDNCINLKEAIIHIPEYYSKDFYRCLKEKDIKFLKSIKNLQLNIMNQNIEMMPDIEELKDLYNLTDNVTQTIAHDRYATQEVCDRFGIPTHLFSVNIDLSKYKSYSFEEKEKIIVLSPDYNENKAKIVEKLQKEFPDFKFVTVQNMTFSEYMDLISRAYFTISFGEGMDGYFCQPHDVGSIGFAVYNNKFFPDESWKNLYNVYETYDDMYENIVNSIHTLLQNKELYLQTRNYVLQRIKVLYDKEKFKDNLIRFYNREYDFVPSLGKVGR